MSGYLKDLIELFRLKKVNYERANRKTLDLFVKRVKLQSRRQALFESACEGHKKKSRVAMCKQKDRPGFASKLSTLSTKRLRKVILEFFADIGLTDWQTLESKSDAELEKIAKDLHWERVLFMSDVNVLQAQSGTEPKESKET